MPPLLLLAAACSGPPAAAAPAPAGPPAVPLPEPTAVENAAPSCPPGMVLVRGARRTGLRGQPYGIVETAGLARVEAPERRCPAALAATPGAVVCWVQTDLVDPVIPVHPVEVAPFCIDAYPFPGKGARYTRDGMTAWDAERLAELLATGRYGPRRPCTMTEFEVAVAGPRGNRRFVFGNGAPDPDGCPLDAPIGADPDCADPETGVHDYAAVMSHWVVADPDFVAHACPEPPCLAAGDRPLRAGAWVVAGGTRRLQTRQAPLTPHTWHDHGEPNPAGCDAMGEDDQPVICADPTGTTPEAEARWAALVEVARRTGSMTATLEAGLGRPVCPAP